MKLTPEEAKAAADEILRKAKAKREKEERELERLREQERVRSGKELLVLPFCYYYYILVKLILMFLNICKERAPGAPPPPGGIRKPPAAVTCPPPVVPPPPAAAPTWAFRPSALVCAASGDQLQVRRAGVGYSRTVTGARKHSGQVRPTSFFVEMPLC